MRRSPRYGPEPLSRSTLHSTAASPSAAVDTQASRSFGGCPTDLRHLPYQHRLAANLSTEKGPPYRVAVERHHRAKCPVGTKGKLPVVGGPNTLASQTARTVLGLISSEFENAQHESVPDRNTSSIDEAPLEFRRCSLHMWDWQARRQHQCGAGCRYPVTEDARQVPI